jgi:hypothetical protein
VSTAAVGAWGTSPARFRRRARRPADRIPIELRQVRRPGVETLIRLGIGATLEHSPGLVGAGLLSEDTRGNRGGAAARSLGSARRK